MNWLARLKKIECDPAGEATKTPKRVSVVSVAPIPGPLQNLEGDRALGASDLQPVTEPEEVGTICDGEVLAAPAMSSTESETFTARLAQFTDKGLDLHDAERVASRLHGRDRDGDDRTLCIECRHFRIRRCAVNDAFLPEQFQRCDRFVERSARARASRTGIVQYRGQYA